MTSIIDAMRDENLFAPLFRGPSWKPWIACLKSIFGIEMDDQEADLFRRCTGRQELPRQPFREAFLIIGRRGGKSRAASLIGTFLAAFRDYSFLAPGEKGVVMVLSVDKKQSRVVHRYVSGIFDSIPILKELIERRTGDVIDLKTKVSIEVLPASFRGLRGYSVPCAIADEVAYWRNEESANPDVEILNALRPAMANIPGSLLICISSPYARRGVLWTAYKKFYGQENDRTLVWVADSKTMNPTLDDSIIQEAYEADEAVASAEYGAQFRKDIESFVDRDTVDICVILDRKELPYLSSHKYGAFCDPSGGSQDSMTLAIGHREKDGRVVLDAIRERRPPFSPEDVITEFVATLKSYQIHSVRGDRFGGEWPRERFRVHGIDYQLAEKSKSEYYQAFLPIINSKNIDLLDHPRLLTQICNLERRTGRGGKDSIDHGPGSHDDLANSAAGIAVELMQSGLVPNLVSFYKQRFEQAMKEKVKEVPQCQINVKAEPEPNPQSGHRFLK